MTRVVVTARLHALPGMEERLVGELIPVVAKTRAEPGCLAYDLHQSRDEPTDFVLVEAWRSSADLESHLAMPYVRELGERARDVLAAPPEVTVSIPALAPHVHPTEQLVVELFVRDIGRSTAFYRKLGFELLRDDGSFVELTWEGNRLFLDEHGDLPEVPGPPQANVRVLVGDVDAWWARAKALDAPVLRSIADRHYGLRDFTILDPDGFGVRFGSRLDQEAVERQEARRALEGRLARLERMFEELDGR